MLHNVEIASDRAQWDCQLCEYVGGDRSPNAYMHVFPMLQTAVTCQ